MRGSTLIAPGPGRPAWPEARPHGHGSTLAPGGTIATAPLVRHVPGGATGELLVAGTIALWGALRVRRRALLGS